jgi:hypothetical protein
MPNHFPSVTSTGRCRMETVLRIWARPYEDRLRSGRRIERSLRRR